jgi:hypothetical protein
MGIEELLKKIGVVLVQQTKLLTEIRDELRLLHGSDEPDEPTEDPPPKGPTG